MKQINVKQAQKWLDKLKAQNLQSYKDVTKFLRKYEKTEDQYDCFIKVSHTLLQHPKLAEQINLYMDEGNKFIVNKAQSQKIKQLVNFIKKNRPDLFSRVIQIVQQMSVQNHNASSDDLNQTLKVYLRNMIQGDQQLERITEFALDLTGEQLIGRLDLEHLKVARQPHLIQEYEDQISKQKQNQKKDNKKNTGAKVNLYQEKIINEPPKIVRAIPFLSIASIDDQKFIFRHLQKNLDQKLYGDLIKLLKLYFLNIISKNQIIQMVNVFECQQQLDFLRQIIQTRQSDRRRLSLFKPLNDMDFSTYQRASPSYVTMPISYPFRCSKRAEFYKQFLNEKWVSVPHGSEENFNVRFKNANEVNLLKSQDQRYEFDLYMKRLNKSFVMLDQILKQQEQMIDESKINGMIDKIISMGIIQFIYKNCTKDQKEELEWHLKTNQTESLKIIKERIGFQIKEMESIKSIHAIRTWYQVAFKNFSKALDLKGFQFKKNQKQKIKLSSFVQQLHERVTILNNGGETKMHLIPFEDRRQFFEVLNSFESSSRTEKCLNRQIPKIQTYDLQDQTRRKFYPVMILAFENKKICQKVYSLIHFYIDSYSMGQTEKYRCKLFLQYFFINYFGWESPKKRYLTQFFDEQKLYQKINQTSEQQVELSKWIDQTPQQKLQTINENQQQISTLQTFNDIASQYGYLPEKSQKNKVIYGSEQLYAFIRFVYTLYERIIKMEEVSESQQKIILFELLFYACIKAKQGVKFEENLNMIFGKHAYLFSTVYKLCDNLVRSLANASSCLITTQSFRLSKLYSEDIYFLLLNKYCLNNNLSNSKLLRFTYEPQSTVLYLNLLDSYYKVQENPKELFKKRVQISRGIQIYTIDSWYGNTQKKKRKLNESVQLNNMQYIFQGSTIKMLNHHQKQDVLYFFGKQSAFVKNLKREMKRVSKINSLLN